MSDTIVGDVSGSMKSKFTWKIPNVSAIQAKSGKAVYSPLFSTPYRPDETSDKVINLHWRLRFYPNGGYVRSSMEDYVSVCLEHLDEFEVKTDFSIALIDTLNDEVAFEIRCYDKMSFGKKNFWGWTDYTKKSTITDSQNGCLVNNTLTILCKIYSMNVTLKETSDEEDCFSESSIKHYQMLFDTGKFSDVTITIGNQKLRVHKSIVTSLSPVFLAMFENQMKEHNENVVKIIDIEFDIMKEMLRYMYVRKVNGLRKIACDLFVAADKYCVKGLKKICEKSLCDNLDIQNALERMEMAVQFNMVKLKRNAIKFVVGKLKSFDARKEFKDLSSECKSELLSCIEEKFGDGITID